VVTRGRLNVKQIVYVLFYIAFIVFACNLMLAPARAKPLVIPTETPDYVATVWGSYTQTAVFSVTPTFTSMPSPTVTITPLYHLRPSPTVDFITPVSQNTNKLLTQVFALSFYDPHIGYYFPEIASVNCLQWDAEIKECVSKVHHGQDDYHQWLGKGAACPSTLPYDAVFRVITPVQLAGVWRCIDIGDLDRNGLHYIDFMLSYPDMIWTGYDLNSFPWSSDVVIELLSTP
jgi:hypothetical protein